MALNLKYQTVSQFADRLRLRYLKSSKIECARLAKWLLDHIDAGDFTDTQVRNAFGLSVAQYNTLKTKWTNLRTAYNAVMAAQGE
jgi:hypothetical protein